LLAIWPAARPTWPFPPLSCLGPDRRAAHEHFTRPSSPLVWLGCHGRQRKCVNGFAAAAWWAPTPPIPASPTPISLPRRPTLLSPPRPHSHPNQHSNLLSIPLCSSLFSPAKVRPWCSWPIRRSGAARTPTAVRLVPGALAWLGPPAWRGSMHDQLGAQPARHRRTTPPTRCGSRPSAPTCSCSFPRSHSRSCATCSRAARSPNHAHSVARSVPSQLALVFSCVQHVVKFPSTSVYP
jgi:hypothetical protein